MTLPLEAKDYDYGSLPRAAPSAATAFDDRVGSIDACAACHRNHGTPYQWEKAPTGKRCGQVRA